MKIYRCTQCGHELQRPTQPYACPQCGRQAVGLFRVVTATGQPAPRAGSPSTAQHGGIAPVRVLPGPGRRPPLPVPTQPVPPPIASPSPSAAKPKAPQGVPIPPSESIRPAVEPGESVPTAVTCQPPQHPPVAPDQPQRPNRPHVLYRPPQQPTTPQPSRAAVKPPAGLATRPTPTQKPEPPKRERVRPVPIRPASFVWAYPVEPPDEDEARPMRHAPAVDPSGQAYLCRQGRLVAIVEEQGQAKIVWEYVVGSHVPGPVVLASDGTLRLHSADGYLHGVTAAGKQAFAPVHLGKPLGWAAPVVDAAGNTWISAYDGGLIHVTPEGKTSPQRFFRSRQKFDSAGIILDGVLYIGSEDGYLVAIHLNGGTGVTRWNQAIDQGYTGGYLNSSPAFWEDGGVIVVAARDEWLFGFVATGETAWSIRLPGQMLGSPVIDRHGNIYVGVSQFPRGQQGRGQLISVDGNLHQIRWQYEAEGPVESTPAIGDDDLVYFGDNAGTLHAVDQQGSAVWTAKVEAPARSAATILAPGRVAFGLDNDTLVVLRCSAKGLSPHGWPKYRRTTSQSGGDLSHLDFRRE